MYIILSCNEKNSRFYKTYRIIINISSSVWRQLGWEKNDLNQKINSTLENQAPITKRSETIVLPSTYTSKSCQILLHDWGTKTMKAKTNVKHQFF